jgi:5-methylcytosine-specific restriction enzyme A
MRPGGAPPVMSRCYEEGRVTPVYQVDHVVPHRGDPALFKDRSKRVVDQPNWQSLCQSCGARKSAAGL